MFLTTTRFAPSPTGYLHLGHAASAIFARAQAEGGRFLLRIEDIDKTRCRESFVHALIDDLTWLGLDFDDEIRRQSLHFDDYRAALAALDQQDLLYPCFCTRADIAREINAIGAAPHGPDGPIYPGLCRGMREADRRARQESGEAFALRLDVQRAMAMTGPLTWHDRAQGWQHAKPDLFGDVVLARKDIAVSYHLAVTVDDAKQGVTLVTRGVDLFQASHLHRLLQALLDLPVPEWHHHALLTGVDGKRLAKRDNAPTIRSLRAQGWTAQEVRTEALAGLGGR
jgi:glutamyl-Q tRNA(Asp) synthetase